MLKKLFAPENLLNLLLVFVPIAVVLEFMHANSIAIFAASGLAIIPLAGWMGRATEHLSEKLGEGFGGLLNATFGNAAELIIALMALRKGLFDVVKASLTGSIIGNVLLVLGLSVLLGGLFVVVGCCCVFLWSGVFVVLLSVVGWLVVLWLQCDAF